MLSKNCVRLLLPAFFMLGMYLPVRADGWDPVGGTYYEISPYYAYAGYASLAGAGRIYHTGFMLTENNGVVGTLLLTLSPQDAGGTDGQPDIAVSRGRTAESDLIFYFSELGGDVGGFEWNFYLGSFPVKSAGYFKLGVKTGIVSGIYMNGSGQEGKWNNFSLGVPVRYKQGFYGHRLLLTADFDLNLISLFDTDPGKMVADGDDIVFAASPFRISIKGSPHHHLLLFAGLSVAGIEEGSFGFKPGYFGGLGVRF